MQRREFIKHLAVAGAAVAAGPLAGELFVPFAEGAAIEPFSFAHITDLHLDVRGTSTWQHREKSVPLFIDCLRQIGRLPELAFVVFGGDQIHPGPRDRDSLFVFQEWVKHLSMPYYILLGNAEVSPVPGASKLMKADFLLAWRGRGIGPGRTSWAFDPVPGVRIIGFDVTKDGVPYGEAGPGQLRWLAEELSASRKHKLVIVMTHQLLQHTTPQDLTPAGALWMVRDRLAVRDLLEKHPNVRMVVSGHHHAAKVDTVNGITYVADPAIVTYPCAFRLFTVSREGIHIRNVGLDDEMNVKRARDLLVADPYAKLYDPDRPERVLEYSVGLTAQDREAEIRF